MHQGDHPVADARDAVRVGADGLIVSNHGGRQLDGALAVWAGPLPFWMTFTLSTRDLVYIVALTLMAAARIQPARLTPLPPHWIPRLMRVPDPLFRRLANRMRAIDPLARSSMWDDLEAGRTTEIDWINGEVIRLDGALRKGLVLGGCHGHQRQHEAPPGDGHQLPGDPGL